MNSHLDPYGLRWRVSNVFDIYNRFRTVKEAAEKQNIIEFIQETDRLLSEAIQTVSNIDADGSHSEQINSVFRSVHTIKGTAGFFNITEIKSISHKMESLLDKFRANSKQLAKKDLQNIGKMLENFHHMVNALSPDAGSYSGKLRAMNETIDKVAEDAGFVNYYTPLTETYTTIAVNRDKLKEILKPEMLDMVKNTLHSIESTDPGIDKNLELLRANLRSMATEFQHVHDKLHCLAQTGQVYAGFILKHPPVQPNHLAILREVLDLLMSTLSLEMMDVSEMNMDISEAVEKVKRILSEYGEDNVLANIIPGTHSAFNQFDSQHFSIRVDQHKLSLISSEIDNLSNLTKELSAATVEIQKSRIGTAADTLSSLSFKLNKSESRLKHLLSEVNKVPLIALFQRLQFLIEQVSKQLRKDIRLEYVGEEVQLDKTILEAFKDCLSHLVRNSCDHGIESQEERLSKNKHPYGTIHIGAVEENGMLQIRFRDDGRGINVEKLKNKLIAQKMFTATQLQKMSREEIMRQILLPGVSTTDKVTEISGRGVGLDVLNHAVEKLNGHIEIYSEPDEYTEIAFNIPIL